MTDDTAPYKPNAATEAALRDAADQLAQRSQIASEPVDPIDSLEAAEIEIAAQEYLEGRGFIVTKAPLNG